MRKLLVGVAAVGALAASGAAFASGAFVGRVGVTAGNYKYEDRLVDQGCCGNPVGTSFEGEYDTNQYGLLGGLGINVARFFADVGVEYIQFADDQDIDGDGDEDTSVYRTDFLLTLGAFIGDSWSAFGGYRHATFGDGFFSDDLGYTEDGPFVGAGVSFRVGKTVALGASAAYNFITLSQDGVAIDDIDLNGLSVKGQLNFVGTPHAVFLRWQRFDGDESVGGSYDYEYTEDYVNLGYQATFDFASW